MSDHYVLDESGEPVAVDLMAWAKWFERSHAQRVLGKTRVGDAEVSTVFLGLDYSWGDDAPALLWETMVFSKDQEIDNDCWRYPTRAEALAGHEAVCHWLRGEAERP